MQETDIVKDGFYLAGKDAVYKVIKIDSLSFYPDPWVAYKIYDHKGLTTHVKYEMPLNSFTFFCKERVRPTKKNWAYRNNKIY